MRAGSKEERAEILVRLTTRLIDTKCSDFVVLTEVDRLCRRAWGDVHRGWVRWSHYMEGLLGQECYDEWARANAEGAEPIHHAISYETDPKMTGDRVRWKCACKRLSEWFAPPNAVERAAQSARSHLKLED